VHSPSTFGICCFLFHQAYISVLERRVVRIALINKCLSCLNLWCQNGVVTHGYPLISHRSIHCLIHHSLHNAKIPALNSMQKCLINVAASALQVGYNSNDCFTQPNSVNFQMSIICFDYLCILRALNFCCCLAGRQYNSVTVKIRAKETHCSSGLEFCYKVNLVGAYREVGC